MQKDDIKVLQEIQKNTEMAMRLIDTLSGKVYDDNFAIQLSKQSLKYSDIHNKAMDKIIEAKSEPYASTGLENMMLVGGIHMNTLLNTSTSHIAEMMIQGSNRGLTEMWKTMNTYEKASNVSMEIANELVDFEEKNIERLKKYL